MFLLLLYDCLVRRVRFNSFSDSKREITHQQFQFSTVFVQCLSLSLRNTIAIRAFVCVRDARGTWNIYTLHSCIYRSEIALNLNRIQFACIMRSLHQKRSTKNKTKVTFRLSCNLEIYYTENVYTVKSTENHQELNAQRSIGLP